MKTTLGLAKMIDHSILHPTLTDEDLERECTVALKYNVASACVKPYAVPLATALLAGSDVLVCSVVGFPAGNSTLKTKVFETNQACDEGATEIDMVINIAKAIQGDWDYVEKEIALVTDTCHANGAIIKAIFETDFVTAEDDIVRLCEICTAVGADFVKTSTGYGFVKGPDGTYSYFGATIPILKLMKASVGPNVQVKAAGGVRTLDQLLAVREAGCSRAGATATAQILEDAKARFGE